MATLPTIALVGRPNAGKSALFNRLIGRRKAIVSHVYGTTRDIIEEEITIGRKKAVLMDLAGLSATDGKEPLSGVIQEQANEAVLASDIVLFCVDASVPLTGEDLRVADILRKGRKPILVVATKADNDKIVAQADEVWGLGLGKIFFVSSEHNIGIVELKEAVSKELGRLARQAKEEAGDTEVPATKKPKTEGMISFCLVGKPNVGKSSLFNALLQQKKAIVSNIPGTTRDAVDTIVERNGKKFLLVDTAGLRRPGKRERGIEFYSVRRCMDTIKRSDVCLLVLDGMETVSKMDQAVSSYILEEKKALIVVINKWDIAKEERIRARNKKAKEEMAEEDEGSKKPKKVQLDTFLGESMMNKYLDYLQEKFDYLAWAPILFVSAKSGENVDKLWETVEAAYAERHKRIGTGQLNSFLQRAIADQHPTGTKGIFPKLYYGTQVDVNPPQFVLFVNQPDTFHFSWRRYLEKQLREKFGFVGTPISIEYRARKREDRTGGK